MTLRRGVALCCAMIGCSAGLAAAAAGPAQATSTICVGLVVDAGSLGGGVSTGCETVPRGDTGLQVLQAGGHRIRFRSDGLICQIDSRPASCAADSSHYWAYFHRSPGAAAGSWTYSTEGAASYQPANGSTDGWIYDDGSDRRPAAVPYSQICRSSPSPRPSAHASSRPSAAAHSPGGTAGSGPGRPVTPGSASRAATPAASRATAGTRRHRAAAAAARRTVGSTALSTAAAPSATASTFTLSSSPRSPGGGSTTVLELVIGALVVVGLGVAAALRYRRSGG